MFPLISNTKKSISFSFVDLAVMCIDFLNASGTTLTTLSLLKDLSLLPCFLLSSKLFLKKTSLLQFAAISFDCDRQITTARSIIREGHNKQVGLFCFIRYFLYGLYCDTIFNSTADISTAVPLRSWY